MHVGAAQDDTSILAVIAPVRRTATAWSRIDAPLVVTNPTGQRPCEAALNRDFAKFEAGATRRNTGKPEFAGIHARRRLAAALGPGHRPALARAPRAIEVYPHPADRRAVPARPDAEVQGQAGPHFEDRQRELLQLMTLIEGLARRRRRRCGSPSTTTGWNCAAGRDRNAKSELRRVEDPVDAVLCAYVALYWYAGPTT